MLLLLLLLLLILCELFLYLFYKGEQYSVIIPLQKIRIVTFHSFIANVSYGIKIRQTYDTNLKSSVSCLPE